MLDKNINQGEMFLVLRVNDRIFYCDNISAFYKSKIGDSIRIFGYNNSSDIRDLWCDSVNVLDSSEASNEIHNNQPWKEIPNW